MNKELLILTLHMTEGGAERVLSELINEWVQDGYKVTILETAPEMYTNSYNVSDKVEYVKFNRGKNGIVNSTRAVRFVINEMNARPDATVIGFTKGTLYLLAIASFFTKNRIVVSERNDPYSSPYKKSRRILRDMVFRRADACVFQTNDAKEYFPKKVQAKSAVIPNPINPELPTPFNGEREKRVITACRLDIQKNVPMAIMAFKKFSEEFPEYTFSIFGRGNLENEIRSLIDSENLTDKVKIEGFSDNIYNELNKSSIFVLSSNHEGISNSMLEALALGVPSVVTDCPIGGAKMVIQNHVNGILVPVGNVDAMYEGMKYIAENKERAKQMSLSASNIREAFPVKKIAEEWAALF